MSFAFARSYDRWLAILRVEVEVVEHGVRLETVGRCAAWQLNGVRVRGNHIVVETLSGGLTRQRGLERELLRRVHQRV